MNKIIVLFMSLCMAHLTLANSPSTDSPRCRETSESKILQSHLIHTYIFEGTLQDWGQIYDVQIKEKCKQPLKIVLTTDTSYKITLKWPPKNPPKNSSCIKEDLRPKVIVKPAPRIYSALSSSNKGQVVVRNRDENDILLPKLIVEVYYNIYDKQEHPIPLLEEE